MNNIFLDTLFGKLIPLVIVLCSGLILADITINGIVWTFSTAIWIALYAFVLCCGLWLSRFWKAETNHKQ